MVAHNDWSTIDGRVRATTDHALGHTTIECSHDRSQDGTIDPTIGRRPSRLIVRHDWSYDRSSGAITDRSLHRSLIATTSRTISYDGSCHRYFRIVRDSATTRRYQSPYASAAGYRSKHCRSFAPWHNRNHSYDPEIVWFGVTVALVARRLHVIIIWLLFPDKSQISYRGLGLVSLDNVIFHDRLLDRNYVCRQRPRYLIFNRPYIVAKMCLCPGPLPRTPPGGGGFQRPQLANVESRHSRGPHRIAGPRAPRPHDPPLHVGDIYRVM